MWSRNNNVSNQNLLKHFIYLSFSKSTTLFLCLLYYRYSSKSSSFFCILSFLVKAIFIDQTFYSAIHYLAAVWLNSRHNFNIKLRIRLSHDINFITHSSYLMNHEISIKKFVYLIIDAIKRQNNIRELIKSMRIYDHWIAREFIAHSMSENKLFNLSSKACESDESKQSVLSYQFSESVTNDALIVSLLQRCC